MCAALGLLPAGTRRDWIARIVAILAIAAAFTTSLILEGFAYGAGKPVAGDNIAAWLGASVFRSDALSNGLGGWVLAIGLLAVLKVGSGADEQNPPLKIAASVGLIAALYSLAFTLDLRAFAAQILLVVLLVWALSDEVKADWFARQRVAIATGAVLLLGAVLLVGRTTGGEYSLDTLSLSALTLWPLALVVGWVVLWVGLVPFTGWSALTGEGAMQAVQGLALGAPVLLLILRLQALITEGALTGSTPGEWASTMATLAVLGGITAVVGGAGVYMWAGTSRWQAAITAYWLGLVVWALGMDSPAGRWAALALFATFGLGMLALEMADRAPGYAWMTRTVAGLSLAGVPITAGFVGLWLLSTSLLESRTPSLTIILLGAAVLSACGTALHLAQSTAQERTTSDASADQRYRVVLDLIGYVLAGIVVMGGILPGLWLPYVERMADVAGIGQSLGLPWPGIVEGDVMLPLTMLGAGLILLALLGWLIRASATSRVEAGALLPTALDRLQDRSAGLLKAGQEGRPRTREAPSETPQALRPAPPAFVWWLSLAWLERGIYDAGALLGRLGAALGRLMERLEGRYFLPLDVLLALLTLLAITR